MHCMAASITGWFSEQSSKRQNKQHSPQIVEHRAPFSQVLTRDGFSLSISGARRGCGFTVGAWPEGEKRGGSLAVLQAGSARLLSNAL